MAGMQRREPRAQAALLLTRALADFADIDPSGAISEAVDKETGTRSGQGAR